MPSSESETEPTPQKISRRQRRAEATRKRALSPVRILLMVLMLPVTTLGVAMGVYLRTSDYEGEEALIHLIAMAGCDAVQSVVPGPFFAGGPGYHPQHDPDGDGIACDTAVEAPVQTAAPRQAEKPQSRSVGSAKFVRP